ncbi:MAG: S8 family serine peptidase, partial [Nocardioides sp.]
MNARARKSLVAAFAASTSVMTVLGVTGATASAPDAQPAEPAPMAKPGLLSKHMGKLSVGLDRDRAARQSVFVRLTGRGAAAVAKRESTTTAAREAADDLAATVNDRSDAALSDAKAADDKAKRLFTVSNAVPGIGMELNADAIEALAERDDVVKISRIYPKKLANANSATLIKAVNSWKYAGGTGEGVSIGVIDDGLDYTHADFGGVGTPEAYEAAIADETAAGWRESLPALGQAKVAGGYDFVGNDYDADPDSDVYQPVPNPDPNPIGCGQHGTHVAGSAGGYGVTAEGKTFDGDYATLTRDDLLEMKVGPGMAPESTLYPLKVFGCDGSTDAVIPALDWALDPNGDGDFSDHLDIVNLSLGSDYGVVDDPENDVVDALTAQGVLSVISAGNNGDLTDTAGSPGNAVSSLGVASTVDAYQLRDGLTVDAPANLAGVEAGQFSSSYDWANNGPTGAPVSGEVVAIPGDNADGCDPLSAEDAAAVAGKVAWLEWDDDDATRRCGSATRSGNVVAEGAIGAVFTSKLDVFGAGILGIEDIPVLQLPKDGTDKLRPAAEAGTLQVTFDGAQAASIADVDSGLNDTISSFTSRGTHGSLGVIKPDVAAPGDTIASAGSGTGDGVLVLSGTSMAAPTAAGVAALVKANHPEWKPNKVKAAVMNTAGHDLWTGKRKSGLRYGPARVGSGRVDALRAVSTSVIAWSPGPKSPVSVSFGVVPVPVDGGTVVQTRKVKVANTSKRPVEVSLSYESINSASGVSYSVWPRTLTLDGKDTKAVRVTMKVRPTYLRHEIDPTMDMKQLDLARQFVSDSSGRLLVTPAGKRALRVPVFAAAKPVSTTTGTVEDGVIVLNGQGVDQGSSSSGYVSLASVLQYGASSGVLPECAPGQVSGCADTKSERAGDLKYVGAGSSGEWLWFGIATRGEWATVGNTMSPYVDFDVDGDSVPDYETYVQNVSGTDVLVAFTIDLNTGDTVDIEPVNFNLGNVDTNVFDSDVILLPVLKEAVGVPLDGTSAPISYSVGTFSGYTGEDIDSVDPVEFDAGAPALATGPPLHIDADNASIAYTTTGDEPVKALL